MLKKFLLGSIKIYQSTLSLDHGPLAKVTSVRFCRFQPTCSQYCYQAIQKYGSIKGSLMGLWRIARCNPWNKGGRDPLN